MAANSYSAKDIQKLEGLDHVRHRVGMYLGSTSDEGITTGFRELVDNSVDEGISGFGKTITLLFHQDGSAEVRDEGRGLPVDTDDKGVSGIELALGNIGAGGKFNSSNYEVSGGLNGVGAAATNATSVRFDVKVYREGKLYELSFKEGKPGHFAKPDDPLAKFTSGHKLKVSKDPRSAAEKKKAPTGTWIRYWPDFSVFMPDSKILVEDIKFRVKSTAFLLPGLSFKVVDGREDEKNPVVDEYLFAGGLVDMVPTLSNRTPLFKPVSLKTEGSFSELKNVLNSDGTTERKDVDRHVDIDMAFTYTNETEDTILRSYVNIINTKNGGTHESGMWRALSRILINHIKGTKGFLKAKEEPPIMDDVRDGFIGAVSVKFPEPVFSGQEKSELSSQQITTVLSQSVGNELKKFIENKKNDRIVKVMCQKIVEASRVRLAAKQQKDLQKKKSALETAASMPPKLVECEFVGHEYSELMLVEGDSALGTMRKARDARYQALFPLRGKVLNVFKAPTSRMLENAECAAMIQVMGAGSGRSFDMESRRYDKIIIETDADVDGAHIKALLITFFWKYMKDLVMGGKLYAAMPPLFEVKLNEGSKNEQTMYALDQDELDKIVKKLKGKYSISRNKGLGEMTDDGAYETLLNPETRRLKQITVEDVEAAEYLLDLAMGSAVEPRRDWISASRNKVADETMSA